METDPKRRARLRSELRDEGVAVLRGDASDELLLDEIAYAKWPLVHEGRRAGYGAIVTDVPAERFGTVLPLDGDDIGRWRQYADGRRTFVVRGLAATELVTFERGDELELVDAAAAHDLRIVQRREDGVVQVYGTDELWIDESGVWSTKPYARTAARTLAALHDVADRGTLEDILSFCLHVLSARGTGATLVWHLDDTRGRLTRPGVAPVLPARLDDRTHHDALASRLAQLDGACLLDAQGRVIALESHLGASSTAHANTTGNGGTRHSSAQRYSFDVPAAVVLVVSEDGTVTAYAGGQAVVEFASVRRG